MRDFASENCPNTNIADANTGLNTVCNVFEFDEIKATKPMADRQPARG